MGRTLNVNVYPSERRNVNVRETKKLNEQRIVSDIIRRLGPESNKDEGFWHKAARHLSEDDIYTGLEIAAKRKPAGLQRIKYLGGIYSNMLKARGC